MRRRKCRHLAVAEAGDPVLRGALAAHFQGDIPETFGVAVSGGGDSMALLHLAACFASDAGVTLRAVSVNHHLREEAAEELALVARACEGLGVAHDVLGWSGWDGRGNVQDQARQARYQLMADWARAQGVRQILLGHTADDQAETVLMRLGRGAGVDGLRAMRPVREWLGVTWGRPLLGLRRDALRGFLEQAGVTWAEDPTNRDTHYTRIQLRNLQAALTDAGITVEALGRVAQNMATAQEALEAQTDAVMRDVLRCAFGAVSIDRDKLSRVPGEIQRRVILRCLNWLKPAAYAPRQVKVEGFLAAVLEGAAATLEGCQTCDHKGQSWVFREWSSVQAVETTADQLWDGRWRATAQDGDMTGFSVRPLGAEHAKALADHWRGKAPRGAILAMPAIFCSDDFITAPLLICKDGWNLNAENCLTGR